jgi:hypothetical protein
VDIFKAETFAVLFAVTATRTLFRPSLFRSVLILASLEERKATNPTRAMSVPMSSCGVIIPQILYQRAGFVE